MNDQQRALAAPIPDRLVERKPGSSGADYVGHDVITAYLNAFVPGWSFRLVSVIRGDAPELAATKATYAGRVDAVLGGVWSLTANVDGNVRTIDEVGTVEHPSMHHDGENLKLAASDAIKRCAMRLGLGLDLWLDRHAGLGAALLAAGEPPGVGEARRVAAASKQHLLAYTQGDVEAAKALWQAVLDDFPGIDLDDPASVQTVAVAVAELTVDNVSPGAVRGQ